MTVDRDQFRDRYRYSLALASEAAAPALRAIAHAMSRSRPTPPQEWRTGVILGNGHIGDVLFRTCSLQLLAAALPQCRWSYLTTPAAAGALAHNPSLHEVLPWNLEGAPTSLSASHVRELAQRDFDVALCSENFAHYRALLLALRLHIPNRVAFTAKGLSALATLGVRLPELLPHAEQFRRMVQIVTGSLDSTPLVPRIYPSAQDVDAAAGEWARLNLDEAELVIACSATTRQEISACPPQLFTDILRDVLNSASDARVVLTGVAGDRDLLQSMAVTLGDRAIVSAGNLSVLGFGALLRRCSAFLGPDSGARHLANAAAIPVYFVRNMGTSAVETGVYSPGETDIALAGEYLSAAARERAFRGIDRNAVASGLVAAARQQAHDRRADKPR
ncbi:MAG: glycosyltransferase family 9 protein [Gemmatimonadaceae bacterium]